MAIEETLHTLELSVADFVDRCESGQYKRRYFPRVVIRLYISPVIVFPLIEEDADFHSCPSLLITTERRNLNDLDDCVSIMIRKLT